MARSFFPIGAVVLSLFCTGIDDFASSNYDVQDWANLLAMKDIAIDTVHDYLQEQEKRLATLRKHIKDYSEEHKEAIQKLAQSLSSETQESFVNDDEEIEKVADEVVVSGAHNFSDTNYEKLCNGEMLLPANIQKKMKCRYVDHGMPFLKIAPFKQEEVHLDPNIVVYHDVIYEEEIEFFKTFSSPKLESAKVQNPITGKTEISKDRIAKTAWLTRGENLHVELLNRRVEYMTGLTADTAENLQIAYYDIGGYFAPHCDFVNKEDVRYFNKFGNGNRIATVLFYMNDVAKGGATAFTELKVTIWPKKGSAVVWHNVKRNGEGDLSTMHGACPVLSGTKWIATKWLHQKGQEFLRPCSLLENE